MMKMKSLFALILALSFLLDMNGVTAENNLEDKEIDISSKLHQAEERALQKVVAFNNLPYHLQYMNQIKLETAAVYSQVEGKTYNELSTVELEKLNQVHMKTLTLFNDLQGVSKQITPLYLESTLSNAIEFNLVIAEDGISLFDILTAARNASTARDIGVEYAELMGYYYEDKFKTWDNPADAYRHFSWNFLNSKDMNVNKSRIFGDIHELALAAETEAKKQDLPYAGQITWGVLTAKDLWTSTKASVSTFNSTFDNASIMDLMNNSEGRKYSLKNYTRVSDAFYDALEIDKKLISYPSEISSTIRTQAWNGWK